MLIWPESQSLTSYCSHILLAKGQTKKPEGIETELLFLAQTSKEGSSFVSMAPHPLSISFVALSQVRGKQVFGGMLPVGG